MNCPCSTNVSEFLAGISIVCLAIHAGIVCFMRPKGLSVRFDPFWNSYDTKSSTPSTPPVPPTPPTQDTIDTDITEKEDDEDSKKKSERSEGGFYSYFT